MRYIVILFWIFFNELSTTKMSEKFWEQSKILLVLVLLSKYIIWNQNYFSPSRYLTKNVFDRPLCLVCGNHPENRKSSNVKRHFMLLEDKPENFLFTIWKTKMSTMYLDQRHRIKSTLSVPQTVKLANCKFLNFFWITFWKHLRN